MVEAAELKSAMAALETCSKKLSAHNKMLRSFKRGDPRLPAMIIEGDILITNGTRAYAEMMRLKTEVEEERVSAIGATESNA